MHRGPDAAGSFWNEHGSVGLGHRRLAIVDLEDTGNQPMRDCSGRFVIVFNGEIYNYLEIKKELLKLGHTFQSTSDTEVILEGYKEWGDAILNKLNGAFAFALFDNNSNQVLIARDRAGEKPLFYSFENDIFYFSSEVKGLLKLKNNHPQIDTQSLDSFLTFGYIPGSSSMLKGVSKLEAGMALKFDISYHSFSLFRYWELPALEQNPNDSLDDLTDELKALLSESIKLQLRADLPVGILLSGGVDSSLIAALASQSSKDISTYTASFPQWGSYDESDHARVIAQKFGLTHTEVEVDLAEVNVIEKLAKQFDDPISDSSMIPTFLLTHEVKKYTTVVLGGDGGDELFGGYKHYDRLIWLSRFTDYSPYFLKLWINRFSSSLPVGFKGGNWLKAFGHSDKKTFPLLGEFFDHKSKSRLMQKYPSFKPKGQDLLSGRMNIEDDILQTATRFDFKNYLVEDILVKIDRASMLNSLEMRAPFLDFRVIDFAFSKVQSEFKANSTERKILLKSLAHKILPEEFNFQRKQGFTMPLKELLKAGDWRDYFYDNLLGNHSTFDKKFITSLFSSLKAGSNNQERLFSLLIFELWKKEYNVSI